MIVFTKEEKIEIKNIVNQCIDNMVTRLKTKKSKNQPVTWS